jgi:exosome complex RNA-binding protein Rrp42 (RNase PH superfamily)
MKRLSLILVAVVVMLSVSLIGLPVVTEAAISEKKCIKGGGTVETQDSKTVCKGGKYDGKKVKVKKTTQTQ